MGNGEECAAREVLASHHGILGLLPYEQAKSLGHRLRLHRMHRGLSHRALARILGVDPGSISRWETGDRRLDRRSLAVIERFLADGDSRGR